MSKYDGTKTQKNLEAAFAGESEARNKYTYFASVAKKEGFEQISDLFLKTANNEKEHAKLFYKHIGNTIGNVNASYPFEFGSTEENLKSAASGENEEWTVEHFHSKASNSPFFGWTLPGKLHYTICNGKIVAEN